MNWLNNISDSTIKAIFAFIMLVALVAGFFYGLIAPEIFTGFFGIVLTSYFKNEESKKLRESLAQKDDQIMALSTSNTSVLLAHAKEKV